MQFRLHRLLLRVWALLPPKVRRLTVRTFSPSYTAGSICVIERPDGKILLVQQAYRERWGLPGGLLKKGEEAADGARRETLEEVALMVDLVGEPAIVVDAERQRIDLIFRAKPAQLSDLAAVRPTSPEIIRCEWFAPDALPELQFETANALVALARSSRSPQALPLLDL
jgi:8-oxo-dGTP diphosphatase